jgi:predicted nuclease of predicted toxin-antitoxin system
VNFLGDESLDRQIVVRLRQDGHHVWYVAEMSPGISDDVVLELANKENALLLTADKDFGELVYRQRRLTMGVILVRMAGLSAQKKAETVSSALNKHAIELRHAFSVITPGTIRIRREHV